MSASLQVVNDALARMRSGDVDGALAQLRAAAADGLRDDAIRLLHFQLATLKGPSDEGFAVAAEALGTQLHPRQRSGWALRRGLCFIEAKQRDAAVADLLVVLALKVNDGHMEQARAALLVAALPQTRTSSK